MNGNTDIIRYEDIFANTVGVPNNETINLIELIKPVVKSAGFLHD